MGNEIPENKVNLSLDLSQGTRATDPINSVNLVVNLDAEPVGANMEGAQGDAEGIETSIKGAQWPCLECPESKEYTEKKGDPDVF